MAQAQLWDANKRRYLAAGLCDRCAGQASWGHQYSAGGWGAIHDPCEICAGIVAMFPYPTTNLAWRSMIRKRGNRGPRMVRTTTPADHGQIGVQPQEPAFLKGRRPA